MKITMTNIDDRNEIYTTEEDRGEYMTLTSVGDYVSLMVPAQEEGRQQLPNVSDETSLAAYQKYDIRIGN